MTEPSRSSRYRCCLTGDTQITPACTASECTGHLETSEDAEETTSDYSMDKQCGDDRLFEMSHPDNCFSHLLLPVPETPNTFFCF